MKPEGSHKSKNSKPKDLLRAYQAVVNWKEDEFQQLNRNFCLPITKFMGKVLTRYRLHISQINVVGLPRITHFEFICRAQHLIPSVDMLNVFYYVSYTGGFYSFNSRTTNVLSCSKDPSKSLHHWKHKFFYIHRGMIPIEMHYHSLEEGIPKLPLIPYVKEQWLW
ncbi:hypothetical protein Hanom_Chr05g00392831 [Helianthus anomalus]